MLALYQSPHHPIPSDVIYAARFAEMETNSNSAHALRNFLHAIGSKRPVMFKRRHTPCRDGKPAGNWIAFVPDVHYHNGALRWCPWGEHHTPRGAVTELFRKLRDPEYAQEEKREELTRMRLRSENTRLQIGDPGPNYDRPTTYLRVITQDIRAAAG